MKSKELSIVCFITVCTLCGLSSCEPVEYSPRHEITSRSVYAGRAIQRQPRWLPSFRYLTAALALSGQTEQARKLVDRRLEISPRGPMSRAVNLRKRLYDENCLPKLARAGNTCG